MAEVLGKGFERVLRWIYPGALFVVLMWLSWPKQYENIVNRPSGWVELIIIGLAGGFAAYIIQSNVVHVLVSVITQLWHWEVNFLPMKDKDDPKCEFLKCLAVFFKPYAEFIRERWSYQSESEGFFAYQFSAYHATMITGWLPLIMWLARDRPSSLWDHLPISGAWLGVLFGSMLAAGLFLYLRLTRIDLRDMRKGPAK